MPKPRDNFRSWQVFGGGVIAVFWGNNYSKAFNLHSGVFHRLSQYIENQEQTTRLFTHTGAKKLAKKHLFQEISSRPQGTKETNAE